LAYFIFRGFSLGFFRGSYFKGYSLGYFLPFLWLSSFSRVFFRVFQGFLLQGFSLGYFFGLFRIPFVWLPSFSRVFFRGSYFKGFSLGYFLGLFLGFLPFLWPVVGLRACTSGCWRPAESRPPCTRWSPAGRPTAAARFRGSPPSTAALFQKQKQKTNDKPSMMRSGFALWVPRWSSTRRRTRFFIRFSWVLLDFLGFY